MKDTPSATEFIKIVIVKIHIQCIHFFKKYWMYWVCMFSDENVDFFKNEAHHYNIKWYNRIKVSDRFPFFFCSAECLLILLILTACVEGIANFAFSFGRNTQALKNMGIFMCMFKPNRRLPDVRCKHRLVLVVVHQHKKVPTIPDRKYNLLPVCKLYGNIFNMCFRLIVACRTCVASTDLC